MIAADDRDKYLLVGANASTMDPVSSSPETPQTSAPRRQRSRIFALLPLLVLLPAVLAFFLASLGTERYLAEAEVTHQIVNPSFGTTDRLMATQEVKAQSRALAEQVAADAGLDQAVVLDHLTIEGITAGINEQSTAVRIGFRNESPEVAESVVQAYVDAYLASVEGRLEVPGLDGTIDEINKLQVKRNDLLDQIATASAEGESELVDELTAAYQLVVDDMGVQVGLFNNLRPNTPVVVAEQLGTSWVSDGPVEPRPMQAGALGLIAGLCLAGLALLFAVRPRR